MTPRQVLEEVKASNLRGRGGAGFPTGQKWSFVPPGKAAPRRDTSSRTPTRWSRATFKDRILMEGNPHQLIEGMIIGAYAIEADIALYLSAVGVRRNPAQDLKAALARSIRRRLPGRNILGSGYQPGDAPPYERRTLHLRRGDRPPERARGQARHPQGQTPFPQAEWSLGKTHGRQQCGDPLQCARTS